MHQRYMYRVRGDLWGGGKKPVPDSRIRELQDASLQADAMPSCPRRCTWKEMHRGEILLRGMGGLEKALRAVTMQGSQ